MVIINCIISVVVLYLFLIMRLTQDLQMIIYNFKEKIV